MKSNSVCNCTFWLWYIVVGNGRYSDCSFSLFQRVFCCDNLLLIPTSTREKNSPRSSSTCSTSSSLSCCSHPDPFGLPLPFLCSKQLSATSVSFFLLAAAGLSLRRFGFCDLFTTFTLGPWEREGKHNTYTCKLKRIKLLFSTCTCSSNAANTCSQ